MHIKNRLKALPVQMAAFLREKHIVNFSVHWQNELWSASCFYVFEQESDNLPNLIILTDSQTYHGQLMQKNPIITGTIIHETDQVNAIRGIQFIGIIQALESEAKQLALAHFCQKFSYARKFTTSVWRIGLQNVKFTDNRTKFAEKSYWSIKD